jgi:hypothetical protein
MDWKRSKSLALAMCASVALGLGGMSAARAEYVQCETPFGSGIPLESPAKDAGSSINATQLVWGSNLSIHALSFSGPGTLAIKLTDIEFPQALTTLELLVTDLNGVWTRWTGSDLLIDVNGPAKFFAAVFATSATKSTPGLYHLRADFTSAVPLPAAAWLLLSALGGLAAIKRRR